MGAMHLFRLSSLPNLRELTRWFPPSSSSSPSLFARSWQVTEMAGATIANHCPSKMTSSVVITCIMAASGGLIFGYDIGISGGVTTMRPFLEKFFPRVLRRMAAAQPDRYCVYNSQTLTAFTSSLYIAGLVASLVAGRISITVGRRVLMLAGGAFFLAGAAVNGSAANLEMLIVGRVLLGVGVGLANQATPVYLAETAPPRWRGALTTGFQLSLSVGVLTANLVNYMVADLDNDFAWRISLSLAAIPAVFFLLGAATISDSPSSLAARGHIDLARKALYRIRGPTAEFDDELEESMQNVNDNSAFRRLKSRKYRPQLVMAIAVPLFQQMTGINVIAFYAPVLFQAVGFKGRSALLGSVILAAINLGSAFLSTFIVDRHGRRVLFIFGGIQMFLCQAAVAWLLGAAAGGRDDVTVLVLMCVYAAGFGYSWGPLSWLVPSEIFPSEVRSAGQAVAVAVNFGASFILAQTFLGMLCWMKYGVFVFYAGWIAVMTLFVLVFLPETKGKSLESMEKVWAAHWYWKRFTQPGEPSTVKVSA